MNERLQKRRQDDNVAIVRHKDCEVDESLVMLLITTPHFGASAAKTEIASLRSLSL